VWVDDPPPKPEMRKTMRRELRKIRKERSESLKSWWYQELFTSSSPLAERMTLFWHNHFTSSLRKVKNPTLLFHQNVLLRKHALGNFRDLLHAVAKNPAMVIFLDGQTNRKNKPNENFARELLELFTLGEGNYTEADVKEAARAFTGWKVKRRTGDFRFVKRAHDSGDKTFLRKTGAFDGDDIIDIILDQPRTAELIVEKLWRAFVSPEINHREVTKLAKILRKNYDLKATLSALFQSDAFFSSKNRGALIKSPVELLVGTVRLFGLSRTKDHKRVVQAGRQLGQDLFNPPNVKGWAGGNAWITSHTLIIRQGILRQIASELRGKIKGPDPQKYIKKWLGDVSSNDRDAAKQLRRVLLPVEAIQFASGTLQFSDIESILLDPTFQLK